MAVPELNPEQRFVLAPVKEQEKAIIEETLDKKYVKVSGADSIKKTKMICKFSNF